MGASIDMVATQPDTDGAQNGQRTPATRRNSFVHAFTAHRPPVTPGHFRRDTAFVKEDEALRVDLFAFFPPEFSLGCDPLTVLFRSVE